jgi:hypothetical protein
MRVRFLPFLLAFFCAVFLSSAYCKAQTLLRVSENKRYLVDADGNPFFWLGDTSWGLFHRTTQETAAEYLDIRNGIFHAKPAKEITKGAVFVQAKPAEPAKKIAKVIVGWHSST